MKVFHCDHCGKDMKVKDSFAGQRGLCPYCNSEVLVPALVATCNLVESKMPSEPEKPAELEVKPPTEKQLDYAKKLGVEIPTGVSRKELSRLIDEALDDAPATPGQIEFLHDLGISCPPNMRRRQMSLLLDTALDLEAKVAERVQRRYDEQMKEMGYITYAATETELLKELRDRCPFFFIFKFKDDEFRYSDKPMQGELLWTDGLNEEDVRFAIMMLHKEWNKKFDLDKYADEFDGQLPKFKYKA